MVTGERSRDGGGGRLWGSEIALERCACPGPMALNVEGLRPRPMGVCGAAGAETMEGILVRGKIGLLEECLECCR